MENVKDKIAKLLALADSPNENEARAALLKARELMAQHKLRPEECQKTENVRVRKENVPVSCSKTKYQWAVDLSAIIAEHYCCRAFRTHRGGERTYQIGFVGLEDDFEICKRIYLYAFDCVKTRSDEIFKDRADMYTPKYRRSLAEAYGWGFCRGLKWAFVRQDEEKQQEWGLVMVVPKAVEDVMNGMGKGGVFKDGNLDGSRRQHYAAMGYYDGKKFDPHTRIENTRKEQTALPGGEVEHGILC